MQTSLNKPKIGIEILISLIKAPTQTKMSSGNTIDLSGFSKQYAARGIYYTKLCKTVLIKSLTTTLKKIYHQI